MEHVPARTEARKPGSVTSSTFANIEWVIANHGSITIGDIGANVGCVAAAADQHMCYAMLAQRDGLQRGCLKARRPTGPRHRNRSRNQRDGRRDQSARWVQTTQTAQVKTALRRRLPWVRPKGAECMSRRSAGRSTIRRLVALHETVANDCYREDKSAATKRRRDVGVADLVMRSPLASPTSSSQFNPALSINTSMETVARLLGSTTTPVTRQGLSKNANTIASLVSESLNPTAKGTRLSVVMVVANLAKRVVAGSILQPAFDAASVSVVDCWSSVALRAERSIVTDSPLPSNIGLGPG